MNIIKLKHLSIAGLLAGLPIIGQSAVFEDFSGPVSLSKFWGMEKSIELDTTNQNLIMSARGKAFSTTGRGNNLTLNDSATSLLQADISLTELSTGNDASQNAMLGISGTYYNAQSTTPTDDVGDIFVRLTLGDRGNGPEAWYELQESTDPSFNDSTIVTGSFGEIELNTSYSMSISYDGDNTFTLIFNNGAALNIDGPARMGDANSPFRSINQRLRFGRDNSMPDAWEVIAEDGTTASIKGTIDNVTTDGGLIDNFSGSNLDQTNWRQDQSSLKLVDGKLEMRVTGQGPERSRDRIFIKEKGLNTFGAKVTLLSSSTINNTTRVRGRIAHYLSNDTYDVENGDTPNGWEGMIWTQLLIERASGNNRVVAYAERARNADWSEWDELFFENLGPINLDQEYQLLIEKTGTLVEYKLDGEVVHSFDLATDHGTILSGNDFKPIGDVESSLDTRVQSDTGLAHVRFDDVVTDHTPQPLTLKALDANSKEIAYPEETIVHEGEIVKLKTNVADPTQVLAWVWEQTSGPEVTVAKAGLANKTLGTEQAFSFTVPGGVDTETLEFRVTMVDQSGFETSQQFAMTVDNSAPSTISGAAPVDGEDDDDDESSGSGAFNLAWLLFAYTTLIALRRSRKL